VAASAWRSTCSRSRGSPTATDTSSRWERRTAEVKRDATAGTAEAERDAQIESAKARQAGAIAQAEADTAIATANQRRDVELPRLRAQTEAENARADQAGPLANARLDPQAGGYLPEQTPDMLVGGKDPPWEHGHRANETACDTRCFDTH
jgi:hypothetical protein